MKTTDYMRELKHIQRLSYEVAIVIVAGLVIGYATGGLVWW